MRFDFSIHILWSRDIQAVDELVDHRCRLLLLCDILYDRVW